MDIWLSFPQIEYMSFSNANETFLRIDYEQFKHIYIYEIEIISNTLSNHNAIKIKKKIR